MDDLNNTNSQSDLNEESEKSEPIKETTPTENKEISEDVKTEDSGEVQNTEIKEPEIKQETEVKETPKEEPIDIKKDYEEKDKPEIAHENKIGKISSIIKGKNKEGSFKPIVFVMIISMAIAIFWDKIPFIKNSVHSVLDPSAGALLNWNVTWGMVLIVLIISVFTTLVQKYATDQKALKELKKEQKILQEEMKKYKEHPEKMAELSKKQFAFLPKTFKLTSRAMMFTGVPFILFFRWFHDFFGVIEAAAGEPIKFLGFMTWFWFYLICTMVFSTILRKVFKVV